LCLRFLELRPAGVQWSGEERDGGKTDGRTERTTVVFPDAVEHILNANGISRSASDPQREGGKACFADVDVVPRVTLPRLAAAAVAAAADDDDADLCGRS